MQSIKRKAVEAAHFTILILFIALSISLIRLIWVSLP